jgi:hypothetical protein
MEAARIPDSPNPDDQDGLFDQVIENDLLEQALENRQKHKEQRSAAQAKFKEAHDQAKGILATLELAEDSVVRVGRFRVKNSKVAAKAVAFETAESSRLTISLLDAE